MLCPATVQYVRDMGTWKVVCQLETPRSPFYHAVSRPDQSPVSSLSICRKKTCTNWNEYKSTFACMPNTEYQECGVGVSRSLGFGPQSESESVISKRLQLRALSVSSGLLCNFVAVCLTSVQFILQLKLFLYTIVHLLYRRIKHFLSSHP